MIDQDQSALTPEEAGAFVAQWAERKSIGVEELARRLEVDDREAQSLMRQAKGRLSMQQWLHGKQPKSSSLQGLWAPLIGALVVGIGLGAFLTSYFWPSNTPSVPPMAQLSTPRLEVTTSDPKPAAPVRQQASDSIGGSGASLPGVHADDVIMGKIHGRTTNVVRAPRHGPGAVAFDPKFFQRVNPADRIVDCTKLIRGSVPPDMVIEVTTPDRIFVVHGETTNNLRLAKALRQKDVMVPIQALFEYMASKELEPVQGSGAIQTTREMRVQIGSARVITPLKWDTVHRDTILRLVRNSNSLFYAGVYHAILSQVQDAGDRLFLNDVDLTKAH